MLRIHLNSDDLARIRLVPDTGPLAETMFSLGPRRARTPGMLYAPWRRTLTAGPHAWTDSMAPFGHTQEPVDLITIVGPLPTIDEAAAGLERAPKALVSDEIRYAATHAVKRRIKLGWPYWIKDLPDSRDTRRRLGAAVSAYYDGTVAPHWEAIRGHLDAEVAAQARVLAEGGIGRMLATLHPMIAWKPPVLEIATRWPTTVDKELGGCGLILVPSVFSRTTHLFHPLTGSGPPTLYYPALRTIDDAYRLWCPDAAAAPDRALVALLGATRARALEEVRDGRTTTELARRIGVSPATASHHATVLRNAGLLATHRLGSAVLHTLTPLGRRLLAGPPGKDTED